MPHVVFRAENVIRCRSTDSDLCSRQLQRRTPYRRNACDIDGAHTAATPMDQQGRFTSYSIPLARGAPRTLLRDDPAHRIGRYDFTTDRRRLFYTAAADESDVYVMEIVR